MSHAEVLQNEQEAAQEIYSDIRDDDGGMRLCVCVYACGVFHPVSVRVNVSHVAAHLSLQSACAYNTSVVLSKIRKPMHRILVTDNMLLHNRHGLHFPSSGLFSDSFLLRRHKVNAFHSFNFTKCFY